MPRINKFFAKKGRKSLALVLLFVFLAYFSASWAIDNGSIFLYVITAVFCYMAIKYLGRGISELRHRKK